MKKNRKPVRSKAYEEAWKEDHLIRVMAEQWFREWREKAPEKLVNEELDELIRSKQNPDKALSVIVGVLAMDERDEVIWVLAAGPLELFCAHSGVVYCDIFVDI